MGKLNWMTKACAVFVLWTATAIALPAQTYTVLHSFDGEDGSYSFAGLLQGANGNFYGSTHNGGANDYGTVFEITSGGTLTTLHNFPKGDGAYPSGGLIQGTDRKFYGTAREGGTESYGTVFEVNSSGKMAVLHSFEKTDGAEPYAGLIQATDGNFYGTTYGGGANGAGTIFKITPSGTLTTLYSFCSKKPCSDGAFPEAELIEGINGDFYGTTYGGGNPDCLRGGCGTVFKISHEGSFTTLHTFCTQSGCSDGFQPEAGLVLGADGNFYGTTNAGGGSYGGGTVFKITPSGELTTICMLCSNIDGPCGLGKFPRGTLVLGTDGNLYGTASAGGPTCEGQGCGTIFQVTPGGELTLVHGFGGYPTDGQGPYAGLVQGTDGSFYGTTSGGGEGGCSSYGCGTIFNLSMGLSPFIKTNPSAAHIGSKVGILGTNLTGATSVTFNGTAAVFKVHSQTLIVAEVPSGATTGTIQVQLPGSTLSSNVLFNVLQ